MADAAWACEASCFANNPMPDLSEGLGELEVKTESLRYIVCAGTDLIQDAAFNIEAGRSIGRFEMPVLWPPTYPRRRRQANLRRSRNAGAALPPPTAGPSELPLVGAVPRRAIAFTILPVFGFVRERRPLLIRDPLPAEQLNTFPGNRLVLFQRRARHLLRYRSLDLRSIRYPVAQLIKTRGDAIPQVTSLGRDRGGALGEADQVGDMPLHRPPINTRTLNNDR
jgi:hypothetical protein